MQIFKRFMPFWAACLILFSVYAGAVPQNDPSSDSENNVVININEASVEELESLKGIGESKAEAIVAYRSEQGKFKSVEELSNIKGISKKTVASLLEKNPDRIVAE